MSTRWFMYPDGLRVDCPRCGAKVDDRCRALTSGRTTDIHRDRIDTYWNRDKTQDDNA